MSSKKVLKTCSPSRTTKTPRTAENRGIPPLQKARRAARKAKPKISVPSAELEQPQVTWTVPATEGQQFFSKPRRLKDCCEAEIEVTTNPDELNLIYDLFHSKLNLRIAGGQQDTTLLDLLTELKHV